MSKKTKEKEKEELNPEDLIKRYIGIKKAEDRYIKNPHDVFALRTVSAIEGTPEERLRQATPTEVGEKLIETKMELLDEVSEKVSYADIIKDKDAYELLKELPPLKLGKEAYKDLAEAHAQYKYIEKIGELDKGEKRAYLSDYLSKKTGKKSDYYLAWAVRDIDALYVGIKFEAERKLKEELDKCKEKKKEE